MTTFEGLILGIIHGITEFLPIGVNAHHALIPQLFGLPAASGPAIGALALGSFLALLVYFRHDWASMLSSFLQVIIYRRYPSSIDERLPFFILLAAIPSIAASLYFQDKLPPAFSDPIWIAGSLGAFGLLLSASEAWGRKSKGMYDWNWVDALIMGLFASLMIVPGCGLVTGGIGGALLRNYRRDAAAKFTFYVATALLAGNAFTAVRAVAQHAPMENMSWLTFSVMVVVTFFTGLLAIGGLMKHLQRKGFKAYVIYRLIACIGVVAWLKFHTQS